MMYLRCALCKNRENLKVLYKENFSTSITKKTYSARRIPDRAHFQFMRCVSCGFVFSNPIFDTEKIHELYKKSDFTYVCEAEYLKKTYGRYLQKIIKGKNVRKLNLLDIGCGNGFFLEEARRFGIRNVYGLEPGKLSIDKADPAIKKNIIVDILKPGLFKKETFDIICCFHTLDHVVDPNEFLRITYDLLKKGGSVFFIVHNTDSFSAKLLGEKSPIFDIEHIYLFNKKNLSKIFAKNHFFNIKVFNIVNTYPLSYWVRLFPFPKIIKTPLLNLLAFVKINSFPITLRAGNIAIIAKK